jgi:hypothetical protein
MECLNMSAPNPTYEFLYDDQEVDVWAGFINPVNLSQPL